MAMSINTNVASLNSQRVLNGSQGALNTAMQRLSSGLRVNGAKDDASGLVVADRLEAQVRGNTTGIRNANEGLGYLQVADSTLGKVTEALQRIRELAVQGSNGTNNTTDWTNIQAEVTELSSEITRLVDNTKYNNGPNLIFNNTAINFQVGANDYAGDQIAVTLADLDFTGTVGGIAINSEATARSALAVVDTAIETVGTERTKIGAYQNRFEAVISFQQSNVEALSGARGRIMDADFSKETANLSRAQVLQQAGTAMLAQANQSAQNVMQLLR